MLRSGESAATDESFSKQLRNRGPDFCGLLPEYAGSWWAVKGSNLRPTG
jgi:hypothetical protein